MSETTDAVDILPPERFTGELIIGEHRLPVSLNASAGPSGRVELAVEPIAASDTPGSMLALMRSMARPGNRIDEFCLVCETSDGKQLTSDQVYLVGYSHNSEALLVQLRAREACLRMPAREKHQRPALCFWLLGFECLPPVQVATSLGSIVVRGASRTNATDKITGSICAQGPEGSQATTWRKSSEHMLKHLCSVLGFARGARLSVPVMEFFEGNEVEVIFLETSAGYASQMPPISHLNLQSIVTTALANLNHVDDHRDAFETAVGWLLVPTTFDEVRFLTGMTALESLAARSLENPKRDILSNSAFKKFGKRVRALVDEQGYLDESTKIAIKEKIPELNRYSFSHKIGELLDKWQVSRTSVDDEEIARLIRMRNIIVHECGAREGEDLWHSILVIREILVRLVFSMLQFEGTYQCYILGRHTRRYPDCESVD